MTPEHLRRQVRLNYVGADEVMLTAKAVREFQAIAKTALRDEAEIAVLPAPLAAVLAFMFDVAQEEHEKMEGKYAHQSRS